MATVTALVPAALILCACTHGTTPSTAPVTIGDRAVVCTDRVDTAKAAAVTGGSLAELRELTTFTADERAGECALQGADGGALLSVQVVHDADGKQLAAELAELSRQPSYRGDDTSGVTGTDRVTTALRALDADHYVRVLGLGGSSEEQRRAALALAEDVAARSAAIG